MAKITMTEQEEYPTLPADSIIHVKCTGAEVREVQGQRGNWEKLDMKFKILGIQVAGDGTPVDRFDSAIGGDIYGGVPFRLTDHPENKLRQWVEAILGMPLGLGFELDTDYLVGRECRAVTRTYEKRITDTAGRPLLGHGIETLLPKGQSQAPAPAGWGGNQAPQQAPQANGWGGQQSAPAPAPMTPSVQDPWASQAPQQTQQPSFSGWGASGTDDPPF